MTEPAVASLTPEQAGAEFTTLRENPALYNPAHPDHGILTERMNSLTGRVRGEAEATGSASRGVPTNILLPTPPAAPPASPEELAARLATIGEPQTPASVVASALPGFTAPPGEEVDVDAVVELRTMEMTHDVPVAELTTIANAYTVAWARRADASEARLDQRDTLLLEAWGDDFELHLARAEEMAQQLPPRVREHGKRAGMFRDALIWLKLAELWKAQHGGD